MTVKSSPSYDLSLQSTNTVDSTAPLDTSQKSQKNYAAALAILQSRYGTGGNIPSPKNTPSNKLADNSTPIFDSSSTSNPSPSINSEASSSSPMSVSKWKFPFLKKENRKKS